LFPVLEEGSLGHISDWTCSTIIGNISVGKEVKGRYTTVVNWSYLKS
jgi:hypothetical protein